MSGHAHNCLELLERPARDPLANGLFSRTGFARQQHSHHRNRNNRESQNQESQAGGDTISRPRTNDVSCTWSGYVRWARSAAQRTENRNGRNIRAI